MIIFSIGCEQFTKYILINKVRTILIIRDFNDSFLQHIKDLIHMYCLYLFSITQGGSFK